MKDRTKPQVDRFKEAARELEADHDGASDELMGRMAKMKPEPRKKPPSGRDGKTEDKKPGQ
jgi:hypothetical protein